MDRQLDLPQSIGLSLSGGGFRAAAFHLGVLAYLERAGLLGRVQLLSTVSGGTFTGAKYALSRLEGKPPEQFCRDYYTELKQSRIFPDALRRLASRAERQNPSGRSNIITSAAEVYSTSLFYKSDEGRPYYLGDLFEGDTSPLAEITFNATDFRTGNAFRFQKTRTGYIGNNKRRIRRDDAARLRLGDVVAASSCFPGGFEPLEFPGDFVWRDGLPEDIADSPALPSPLMDGGVYDNQGLESLLLADDRIGDADVLIISDTDRKEDEIYQLPPPIVDLVRDEPGHVGMALRLLFRWNPTLGALDRATRLLLWLSGLAAVALAITTSLQVATGPYTAETIWAIFTSVVALVATSGTWLLLYLARNAIKSNLLARIPQIRADGWRYLRKVRLAGAVDMCLARLSSLLALTSGVFMKRIRSAGYSRTYQDPEYRGRLIDNLIYAIRPGTPWMLAHPSSDNRMLLEPGQPLVDGKVALSPEFTEELNSVPPPSEKLQQAAESAANVPTLLWFETSDELPALVAAGQFTTCANLLNFLARTRQFDSPARAFRSAEVQQLWQRLRDDWRRFQTEPRCLLSAIENTPQTT